MGVNTKWDILEERLLSDNWAVLKTTRLRFQFSDGAVSEQWRETYDRGDGATILPYDPMRRHILLGRQFRWPVAYNNDGDPHLIEAAAGLLEGTAPEERICEEAQEELGLALTAPEFLFELYSSPGSITERMHYFAAQYSADEAQQKFGGLREEGEEIEILDLPLGEALAMIGDGRIRDAKTVILLQYAALHLMPETKT
ncbi:GDP-mannose pyrophosphatase NudK [Pelagimonas phthalicica]|uniref:GDP-mannose pyrophosphatase n=1 Tax=Pelagimonas phthalicica TaxID=1037362 RepID=A0A238JAJ2_9RHOB|nr:GDP-mannose pyrophosphatase [Pelagimonas phthalicica]TDS94499.1 nudix-type nucleoside diphosphatase (YffH/AdpP family) [Pelagimonas phthalicica]SMX26972.1 GDP-mannose pyrophosphatase NudK [Pelagimonas phthalicica]